MTNEEFQRQLGVVKGFLTNVDKDLEEAAAVENRNIGIPEKHAIIAQLNKRIMVNIHAAREAYAKLPKIN